MGRGSAATTGVEGYYTPDGVQISHMFLLRPEGPVDVADMLLFLKVSRGRRIVPIECANTVVYTEVYRMQWKNVR